MKILIIGGTGNISTETTRTLQAQGHDITLVNRGRTAWPGVQTIAADRGDLPAFEERLSRLGQFDCTIDMICYSGKEAQSLVRSLGGKTEQLVFCSTVDVYAKPARNYPVTESHERGAIPAFGYAYEKVACERILEEAASKGAFALTILRPAATYNDTSAPISLLGPGTALMRRMREGKPVITLGDGSSLWVSSHRDDVGKAFAAAAGNRAAYGKSYNVNGDEFITWEAYYSTVARVLGAPEVDFVRIPTGLVTRLAPQACSWCGYNFQYNNILDNSAAKRDLGYNYTIDWEEGARRFVSYHEEKGNIAGSVDHPQYDLLVQRYRDMQDALVGEFEPLKL